MPSPRITGSLEPIRQPVEVDFDPSRGLQVIQRYESAGDNLVGTANLFHAARIAYNLTRSGGKSVLIATTSGAAAGYPEVTVDTWQIVANEIQKDIYEHPLALYLEETWPKTLGYLKRDLDLYNQGLPLGTPAPDPGAVAAGAGKL